MLFGLMGGIAVDKVVDAKGLSCPMPIVRTKKAMEDLRAGRVIEIQATDKGSVADIQAWAKTTGNQYLGTKEDGDVYHHYLRKADPTEVKEEAKYPYTIATDELQKKLENNEKITVLDVREPAEYAFGRIPGSKSIPFGELESRLGELNSVDEIHVVCRTGHRSGYAAQKLTERGFKNVKNVVSGMIGWSGPIEKD